MKGCSVLNLPMRAIYLILSALFTLVLCISAGDPPSVHPKRALVAIVENANAHDPETAIFYENHKSVFLPVLSEYLNVPERDLVERSFTELIENYVEDYELAAIGKAAQAGYERFVGLTDQNATKAAFIDALTALGREGYLIDLILFLHGTKTILHFNNGCYAVSSITGELARNGTKIRAVYQANCFSKYQMSAWTDIGVKAINGADGQNSIVLFAAPYFVEEWIGGKNFQEAVTSAQKRELTQLLSLKNKIPVMEELMDSKKLTGCLQSFGGKNTSLSWNNSSE